MRVWPSEMRWLICVFAAKLLLDHIAFGKNAKVEKKIFPTELIVRNTTATPGVRL